MQVAESGTKLIIPDPSRFICNLQIKKEYIVTMSFRKKVYFTSCIYIHVYILERMHATLVAQLHVEPNSVY